MLSFFFPGTELNQDCIDGFNGLAKPHCGSNDGRRLQVLYTSFFIFKLAKFHQKEKLKIRNLIDFGCFQLPKAREITSKIHQISILGFQFVAKNIEG